MKPLFSLLIKIGLIAGIIYACVASNPPAEQHKSAIAAKVASLQEGDILGQLDRMMYATPEQEEETPAFTYHNYFFGSKVTGPQGATASYGFFNRVFVTISEL